MTPSSAVTSQYASLPATWQSVPLTVLGLSKSGMAVARYAARRGAQVFLSEMLPATPNNTNARQDMADLGITVETGGHSSQCYEHAALVVASPGIPPSSPILQQLAVCQIPVISEVDMAWQEGQKYSQPPFWAGVTGTNGKTTTTTLIGELFKAHVGSNAVGVCGNIGTPVLDVMDTDTPPSHLVVELSSFQLAYSPHLIPNVAVFLNLSPDHINWHGSYEAYKQAKMSMFIGKRSPETVVLNAEDPVSFEIAQATDSHIIWFCRQPELPQQAKAFSHDGVVLYNHALCHVSAQHPTPNPMVGVNELKLRGHHNLQNVAAAIGVALSQHVPPETIAQVCRSFRGVSHRLQPLNRYTHPQKPFACQVVNDSKATNVLATVAAVEAYRNEPLALLLGGRPKNEPLDPLIQLLNEVPVNAFALYGEAIEPFQPFAESVSCPVVTEPLLPAACNAWAKVITEQLTSPHGETVFALFSPACASFDQYRDFEIRGEAFAVAMDDALTAYGWIADEVPTP